MSDIIKNLKELCEQHELHLHKLHQKIRILDTIPKAKALVGKCFKYKSGFVFGGGNRGWFYKRVVGISGERVLVDTFTIDGPDKIEITFDVTEYVDHFNHTGLIPITQKTYLRVYKQVLKHLAFRAKK